VNHIYILKVCQPPRADQDHVTVRIVRVRSDTLLRRAHSRDREQITQRQPAGVTSSVCLETFPLHLKVVFV